MEIWDIEHQQSIQMHTSGSRIAAAAFLDKNSLAALDKEGLKEEKMSAGVTMLLVVLFVSNI
jgi:hypothetical protein